MRLAAVSMTALLAACGHAEARRPLTKASHTTTAEIRISETSHVPACVTPDRLMAFLTTYNNGLDPGYRDIARLYKVHGDAWRVRWDYAFFQMILETNHLKFKRGDGRSGDVRARQNNFAGLGTTGGGVPGDTYNDVSTGVLAHIQHLVAYSGERVDNPIGARTRLTQDGVVQTSLRIAVKRPVTFHDLTGRWATNRSYGHLIETIAQRYRNTYCNGNDERYVEAPLPVPPVPRLAVRPVRAPDFDVPRSSLGMGDAFEEALVAPRAAEPARAAAAAERLVVAGAAPTSAAATPAVAATSRAAAQAEATGPCRILLASFGGRRAVLIRATVGGEEQFTALQVLEGQEQDMQETYLRTHAPGGTAIGEFASREAAVERARQLCRKPRG